MRTKKYTAFYALNQIAFWMEFCLSSSFSAVYLGAIGYSNTELGILLAIGNVLGLVLGTILSDLIDRREHISAGSSSGFCSRHKLFLFLFCALSRSRVS